MPHGNLRICITASRQNFVSSTLGCSYPKKHASFPMESGLSTAPEEVFILPLMKIKQPYQTNMFPLHAPAYHEANKRSLPSCPTCLRVHMECMDSGPSIHASLSPLQAHPLIQPFGLCLEIWRLYRKAV